MNSLSTFGKIGRVLWWLCVPIAFGLAGHHGGWLGSSIGVGGALMILRLMRDLEREAINNEHLRNVALRAVDGHQPTSDSGATPPPPPPPQRRGRKENP